MYLDPSGSSCRTCPGPPAGSHSAPGPSPPDWPYVCDADNQSTLFNTDRRYRYVTVSVVDPNTLKLDPDPEFWPNLDPDPDLYFQI